MTNSRMKQRKLALICVGFIAILIGIAYLRSDTFKCHQLERAIREELGYTKGIVSVQMEYGNQVCIWCDTFDTTDLLRIQNYLNEQFEKQDFWIELKEYNYLIHGSLVWLRTRVPGTKIWSYDSFGECEYTTKGIAMEIWGILHCQRGTCLKMLNICIRSMMHLTKN